MTTIIFWIAFIGLFFGFLNILPVASGLSTEFASSFTLIVSQMKAWDSLFPITELFACVVTITSFYLAVYGFKVVKWVVAVVRGGGSSS